MDISKEEKKRLEQYQTLSKSMPSLANRLAIEIIPPIFFVAIALYTGQVVWFLVLIGLMVVYNVQRVLRQYKNIIKLKSISKKVIGSVSESKKITSSSTVKTTCYHSYFPSEKSVMFSGESP